MSENLRGLLFLTHTVGYSISIRQRTIKKIDGRTVLKHLTLDITDHFSLWTRSSPVKLTCTVQPYA